MLDRNQARVRWTARRNVLPGQPPAVRRLLKRGVEPHAGGARIERRCESADSLDVHEFSRSVKFRALAGKRILDESPIRVK
jgi:hypothetical protein